MKKLILSSVVLLFFVSCQKDTVDEEIAEEISIEQVAFRVDGEEVMVDYSTFEGERLYSQNENYLRLQEVVDSDDLVLYIDSNEADPLLFSSSEKLDQFLSDESKLAMRRAELGRPKPSLSVDISTSRSTSSLPKFTIATAHNFGGSKADIRVNREYSNRHLGFNTCITNGIRFQDNISSLAVDHGLRVRFYQHDDYRGRVLVLDAREAPNGLGWNNLADIKRQTIIIDNVDQFLDHFCGLICTSWNDRITSIAAEETGVNGSRNRSNVCGGSGGGSGGGGGGGGEIPIDGVPIK